MYRFLCRNSLQEFVLCADMTRTRSSKSCITGLAQGGYQRGEGLPTPTKWPTERSPLSGRLDRATRRPAVEFVARSGDRAIATCIAEVNQKISKMK